MSPYCVCADWWLVAHCGGLCHTAGTRHAVSLQSLHHPGNTGGGEGGGLYREQSFTRYNLSCAGARELVVVGTGDQYVATNKEY